MRKVIHAGHVVTIYEGIDEIPVKRFHKFNRFALIDSGVGSDLDDANGKLVRLASLISAGEKEKAITELQNIAIGLSLIANEVSPRMMSFAALVKDVDGVPTEDLSDEGLKRVVDLLGDIPEGFLKRLYHSVKKKVDTELAEYFPEKFDTSVKARASAERERRKALLYTDAVLGSEEAAEAAGRMDEEDLMKYSPGKFSGQDSDEVRTDKAFESACFLLSQKAGMGVSDLTVLGYYNALALVGKQIEAEQKAMKKH